LLEVFRSLCADYMRVSKAKLVAREKMSVVFERLEELLERLQ
jgi:hypothetical protein